MKKIVMRDGSYIELFDFRLLKKNYCCKCGTKLKIKLLKYDLYWERLLYISLQQHRDFLYQCPTCNYFIEYKNQKRISKQQKDLGKLILPESSKIIRELKFDVIKEDNKYIKYTK